MKSHDLRLQSWLSEKCVVADSITVGGLGVFARESIRANELVAVWGGIVYSADEIQLLERSVCYSLGHTIEVAEGFYLASSTPTEMDDIERFNHSCEPNLGFKGQLLILPRRDIDQGEELVFDYETAHSKLEPFECRCGSKECRQKIEGSGWRSKVFREQNSGWLSWCLEKRSTPTRGNFKAKVVKPYEQRASVAIHRSPFSALQRCGAQGCCDWI